MTERWKLTVALRSLDPTGQRFGPMESERTTRPRPWVQQVGELRLCARGFIDELDPSEGGGDFVGQARGVFGRLVFDVGENCS